MGKRQKVCKVSPWHILAYRKSGVTLNQKHFFLENEPENSPNYWLTHMLQINTWLSHG